MASPCDLQIDLKSNVKEYIEIITNNIWLIKINCNQPEWYKNILEH